PATIYGISSRSKTSRTRLNASAGVCMLLWVPSVRSDHQIAAQMASRRAQEDFAFAGLGILASHARLVHLQDEAAGFQDGSNLLAGRHRALQLKPHFQRTRIRVGIGLGVVHPALSYRIERA